MSIALASLTVTAGTIYTYNVGAQATVGAVVVLNESPYGLNVSNGSSSQWIAAQTADLVPCDSLGFNGNLTITTDSYLENASSAPSFLVYFTAFAPGEPIRGTYPTALSRLTNGGNVGIASQLVNDGSATGINIIESTPQGAAGSYYVVTNDGNVTMRGKLTIAYKTGLLPPQATVSDNGNDLAFAIGGLVGAGADGGYAFAAIFNGAAVTPFGIAQSPGVSPLSWIDAAGVLHAPAPVQLTSGHQETGFAGLRAVATAIGQVFGVGVNYKTVMSNVPTSLNNTIIAANGFSSFAFSNIDQYGFSLEGTSGVTGGIWVYIHYITVGNCLLAVDMVARTFDHHCESCDAVTRAIPFDRLQLVPGATPGATALAYACACGATEHFNCGLMAADEMDTALQGSGQYATTRGAQAKLIRQLMTALGLEMAA